MDEKMKAKIAALDTDTRAANFDHEAYEEQWAEKHPWKYHYGSLDAIIANNTPPEDWAYPKWRMLIAILFIVGAGISSVM